MADWTIRTLSPNDLDAAVDVWERSRWASLPWLEERMGYTHDQNDAFFRDVIVSECRLWVADMGGRIIGLLGMKEDWIDRLYVDPDDQGRGVGASLLDHAKHLQPSGLSLFTHQKNEQARRFYEHHGFEVVRFGVSPAPESEPDVEYHWRASPGHARTPTG